MQNEIPELRVYPFNPVRRWMIRLLCAPFIVGGPAIVIFCKPEDRVGSSVLAGFLILFGIGFYWLLSRGRLEVSPAGVELRLLGYMLETPWANVQRLRMDRGQEAFVTETPMTCYGAVRLAATGAGAAYDSTARSLMSERRYIPIEAFSWHLRHQLGDDLRRFAPHLQPSLDAGAPPPASENVKTNRKALAILAALVLGSLAMVIFAPGGFTKALTICWAIVAPLLAVQSAMSAVKAFRTKRILPAVLLLLFAVIMALFSLGLWGELVAPQKSPKPPADSAGTIRPPSR
jgi:hypothetical protein